MKISRNPTAMIVLLMMLLAAVSSYSSVARAEDASRWKLKAGLVLVDASTPFSIDKPSGGQVYAGGNAELGFAIGIEYRLTNLIGLELAAAYAKSPDIDDSTDNNNDELGEGPSFMPIMAGVNFHLMDSENIDVYIGPRVASVKFGNFDLNIDGQNTAFDVSDEIAWGATAGLDFRFGDSPWSFVAEATYLDVDMEVTNRADGQVSADKFDPLIVNLGVSYRF